jgi:hypothetical protein
VRSRRQLARTELKFTRNQLALLLNVTTCKPSPATDPRARAAGRGECSCPDFEGRAHAVRFTIQHSNRFLRALPRKLLDELLPELQPVPLPVKQVLHRPGDHLDFAYFPETGMISVVVDLEDGGTIEVGTIGNEGVAPSSLVLGG